MELTSGTILFAFLLTCLAGASTGIGGILAFFAKRSHTQLLATALGFSAGVMVYVSFMEILPEGQALLEEAYGDKQSQWLMVVFFFVGIAIIAIIDRLVPEQVNPHEPRRVEADAPTDPDPGTDHRLMRMGLLSAGAIALHNFPEGLATFTAALHDSQLGISIAVAIAIHNIPEGVAVAMPVYYASGSRWKGFWYASLWGLAEPIGALVGFAFLTWFLSPGLMGMVLAAVAGIMVFISFDELLPTAEEYGSHHRCIYGFIAGMLVMAVSLPLLD